jgi:hypothetical protein
LKSCIFNNRPLAYDLKIQIFLCFQIAIFLKTHSQIIYFLQFGLNLIFSLRTRSITILNALLINRIKLILVNYCGSSTFPHQKSISRTLLAVKTRSSRQLRMLHRSAKRRGEQHWFLGLYVNKLSYS